MKNKLSLGIELGSTRIKAVLIDENFDHVATGAHDWENRLENGVWTYRTEDVWTGIAESVKNLNAPLDNVSAIGVSAMMHGYLAFDEKGDLLTPFRTWRNTTTEKAADFLTKQLGFNIPQRWSVAHLYQAILDNEPHVKNISSMTTLAGYVHRKLTGENVLGVGDASGMFPLENGKYNSGMAEKFSKLSGFEIEKIFPRILNAGEFAGKLTPEGAKLLDPSGKLKAGIPLCPPEGDAGTGMVATNSITERTGNISAGTSVFAMLVLENELKNVYTEIDMVTTPTGKPVAMVHCNNCTSDLDAWVKLFGEVLATFGSTPSKSELYEKLYNLALQGDSDCGGLLAYNYFSGEPITGLDEGRPLFARMQNAKFSLQNFMRTLLFSSMATLRIGMEILQKENVILEKLQGHGGLFKTKDVAQKLMAAALNAPISVQESASEGGAWGMALLAAYMNFSEKSTLDAFLENVFKNAVSSTKAPNPIDIEGFEKFMLLYKKGIEVEKSAIKYLR
ncbi:MAG: FGGY-family carbohydrate kinase [Defluviitaleaceae bacterium]|nr:FGGY-family carbohydrate kinase [Defluviitaleaceae bacterium]